MLSFKDSLLIVETGVDRIQYNSTPRTLYDPIKYILEAGGKRIRPTLALLACNIFSEDVSNALNPALGIEVFHNFTLLHDDLMDQADKRRNRATVHKVWNANTAILSGDAMMIRAYQLVSECPAPHLKQVIDLFSATALEICEGQQLDMDFESRLDVSVDEYLEMIKLKTAVLLACSLKTGAIIGGADVKDANALYDFGIHIGLAFQLQDDLLDVYGNAQTFGKNIGGDILNNKKTFLLINALNMANPDQKKELMHWINKTDFIAAEKISAVTSLFNEMDLRNVTQDQIQLLYSKGMQALDSLSVNKNKTCVIKEVADSLMFRQS